MAILTNRIYVSGCALGFELETCGARYFFSPTHRSEAIMSYYGVATISRLLTMIGLFCKTLNAQTHTLNAQTHTPNAQTHSNTKILLF